MFCPIKQAADFCPNKLAIQGDITLTYEELEEKVSSIATFLQTSNLKSITFSDQDLIHWIYLIFAALRSNVDLFLISPKLPDIQKKWYSKKVGAISFSFPSHYKNNKDEGKISCNSHIYLLTSGSSNRPKIASFTYESFYFSAIGANEHIGFGQGHKYALTLPLFHVSGLSILFRTFIAKATVVLSNQEKSSATHISLVPTQLYRLMEKGFDRVYPEATSVIVGGGKLGFSLYEKAHSKNIPIYLTYGLTEMSSQVLTTNAPVWKKGIPYLGFPLPYRKIQLGKNQEIYLSGKTLFAGYMGEEKKRKWLASKDRGAFSAKDGFACLGRLDRMFISGGENIQPEEIERLLLSQPEIIQAAVIPYEDAEYGHRPIAYVQTCKNISLEKVKNRLYPLLPSYKIPMKFFPWEELRDNRFFKDHKLSTSSL